MIQIWIKRLANYHNISLINGCYALILEFCMMLFVCVSSVTWNPTNVFTIKDGIGWLSMYYTELKRILWQDWQVALPKLCDWHELKDIKILMNIDHINKKKTQNSKKSNGQLLFQIIGKKLIFYTDKKKEMLFLTNDPRFKQLSV